MNTSIKEQYEIGEKIGEGGYAEVFKCVDIMSQEIFAVKIITRRDLESLTECLLKTEIKYHKDLNHKNIVKLANSYTDDDNYYLVSTFIHI